MKGYEFTDRGKIVIVTLLIAIIIIPAAVIVSRVWNNSQPPDNNGHQIAQQTPDGQDPVVTESPPPDGPDVDPVDPPIDDPGEQGSFDPPVEPPDDPDDEGDQGHLGHPTDPEPPEIGPISINLNAGTMEFMFAPELQDALDEDTFVMLGEFITSPRNTRDSKILIEVPYLPANQNTAITSAITDAFTQYGISRRTLSFESYQSESTGESFGIMLSFIETSSPK